MGEALAWPSIPAMVRDACSRFAADEALVDGDVRRSFGQLSDDIDAAARAVIAAGIEPGDRVAIWAPNVHEWVAASLGTLAAGGVLVPLNTRYRGREAAYILNKSGARLLFTITGFLDTDYPALLAEADEEIPALEQIVLLRGRGSKKLTSWKKFLEAGDGVAPEAVKERVAALGPDDLSDIMFTSGTTGHPKGVLCTHGQSLRTFATWSGTLGLERGDRYLIVNPFFHTFGYKAGIISAIMRGATIIPHAVFDAEQVLRRIPEERVSMLPGPPALFQTILNHPDLPSTDVSSLRLCATGAAAIPVSLIEQMWEELTFETIVTAYGLTEATGCATMCRPGDPAEIIAHTSGRAIDDVEVRIVDEDGVEVPRGDPGEIVVRGFNVMQGYLDDPEQTAEAIDSDGWLHTGDIGVMDEAGNIDITDRLKDMFIVGGFNAYPAEIENDLVEHPAIAQAAVVGMPHSRLGEVGCAFLVQATGSELPSTQDLRDWCRDRMANFKVPRHFEWVEAFPTNPSGKVLKHELRDRANDFAGKEDE
ncbi:MAG: FadD3 family acyl-CoA ligase [Nitriliruptorales bacterium]|nr:FadD3 family acyl-CoA ligase [Nitriliruptorales bacterium]